MAALSGLSLWAQALPSPDPSISWILTGGATGVLCFVVLALIRGWLATGREVSELKDRIASLEAENRDQAHFMRDQAIPLLTRTQDVMVRFLERQAWDDGARQSRNKPT